MDIMILNIIEWNLFIFLVVVVVEVVSMLPHFEIMWKKFQKVKTHFDFEI
jgi:hypothetical protein